LDYIREKKRKKNAKNKGQSPSIPRYVLITRKRREALEFQAMGGDKKLSFYRNGRLKREFFLTRDYFL